MESLGESVAELKQTFKSGRTRTLAWRKNQLRALTKLLRDNEDKLFEALRQDLGKHPVEAFRDEVGFMTMSINNALSCVEKWVATKKVRLPLLLFPSKGELLPEPFGVVLIFGSWNFPITLVLDPLVGAISAGNAAVVKPSELAPACSFLLANLIPLYLDTKAIKVIEGGKDVSEQLLLQKWDKIFFTGSPSVGRMVMTAAAQHLTPVTLELGGKCPAILDAVSVSSEMKVITKRIVGGKWGPCNGQACIGIDYVLVEEKFASYLIDSLKRMLRRFYGENPTESGNVCRIVNKHHLMRLASLLTDPQVEDSVVHGGSFDEERLTFEPTILLNPPLDSELMTGEIFGPLLPIITLNNIEESIEFINSRSKPLTIYAFTKNESFKRKIVAETSSGSVAFNDTMLHFLCSELPFGGVGQSGFGRYHGKYSFDTFSHEKAVMHRGFFPELEPRYPPWNDFKLKFIRFAYRFDYLSLLLLLLGLKK